MITHSPPRAVHQEEDQSDEVQLPPAQVSGCVNLLKNRATTKSSNVKYPLYMFILSLLSIIIVVSFDLVLDGSDYDHMYVEQRRQRQLLKDIKREYQFEKPARDRGDMERRREMLDKRVRYVGRVSSSAPFSVIILDTDSC